MSEASPEERPESPLIAQEAWRRLAHDVRSPLGLISGALEELEHDLAGRPTERSERLLVLAHRGVGHLGRIANLLSAASELASGELTSSREICELHPLLETGIDLCRRMDPRADLAVLSTVPSGLALHVDVEQALQALVELVLDIRRRSEVQMQISASRQGEEIVLEVAADSPAPPQRSREAAYGLRIAEDLLRANGAVLEPLGAQGHRVVFRA